MRLLLLALALAACAARTDQKPAPAGEPAADDAPTPPPESTPVAGQTVCTADAQCPGRPSVHCSGASEGRCVATDGVGCGFIPTGGELQATCCDGTADCNPDTLAAPAS